MNTPTPRPVPCPQPQPGAVPGWWRVPRALVLLAMAQATLAWGVNFNVPLNSLTNHNTSANAAYNQANYGANFGTKTWVSVDPYPTGTQAPVDPSLMDKSLN